MARSETPEAGQKVVHHVRRLIEKGRLRPGDRLPAERDLALQIKVSRPSVRAGLKSLEAMGVLQSKHGSGTFITSTPVLEAKPLRFLAALHGFRRDEMFEARRVLEIGVATLAAERANDEQIAVLSEQVAGMFASLSNPASFLEHDIRFHAAVAAASSNPILGSLVQMVSSLALEQRRKTMARARDLRESAELHKKVFQTIRAHDPDAARRAMNEHLLKAQKAQAAEDAESPRSPARRAVRKPTKAKKAPSKAKASRD